jgi:hypothetical protein
MPDMYRILGILLVGLTFATIVSAQDTLPSFSAVSRGNGKVIVSWHNNYPVVTQISIQRSADSIKNFTTLLTVPDPRLPENGATDNKASTQASYYRLFVVFENGKYLFTRSKKPSGANYPTTENADNDLSRAEQRIVYITPEKPGKPQVMSPTSIKGLPQIEVEKTVFIKKGDSLIGKIPGNMIRQYRDSLLAKTKDTLVFIDGDSLLIKPFIPTETYRVSPYVFTGRYGNIHLVLPDAAKKHYAVKFFDENNKLLFELSAIKDPSLILDKTNFLHAGWFHFELYESDQLKEKNKLFIPKEF